MTVETIDSTIAEIRRRPQQLRARLLEAATTTQAALDTVLDRLENATAEEITRAYQENELAKNAATLIHSNTNHQERQAIQRHISPNAAAIAAALTNELESTSKPLPTALEKIAVAAAGFTATLRSAVGLDREVAAKEREAAESFAPAIAAHQEASRRLLGVFSAEPTFEHYTDACNKIEELKYLIAEASALKI
jgi:hypothetical protein